MEEDKAWNNNSVVAPKSVGPITTKGQMKSTFRASQAGEKCQSNVPRTNDRIQYSDRPDLQKVVEEEQHV